MRIAVISDVHGNALALEAVLADIAAQRVDMTVNLGDMVSGPLEPARVAALLRAADLPSIRGNHDRELLRQGAGNPVDRFTQGQLTQGDLDWLSELPGTLDISGEIFMCHGTPVDDTAPWLDAWMDGRTVTLPSEAQVSALADGYDFPVLLCGHTHVARAVRLRDGRLIVNPGSVGLQMYYGAPDARYAIIESQAGRWSATFRAVPYDHEAAAKQAERHGFPRWRAALTTGWAGAEGLF